MLTLHTKQSGGLRSKLILAGALLLLLAGAYLLILVAAPAASPVFSVKPIDPASLEEPTVGDNRIIIPKIGVDIEYGEGEAALDRGAQWRFPERGNPRDGGNFIIAAHRFELAPTPQETVRKSPFYHIEKLKNGDEIIIDYDGKRYGYTINKTFDVKPTQTEIENADVGDRLTLYSCGLGGASDSRVVLFGEPLGEVTVEALDTPRQAS